MNMVALINTSQKRPPMNSIVQDKKKERKKEGMMEMKAEEDEHQNPLLSNRCESAVRGNRISSIDYDIQPAINCNMRWGFSRTAE